MNLLEWWCLLMPWHKHCVVETTVGGSLHTKCNYCGREYGINNRVNIALPWRLLNRQ